MPYSHCVLAQAIAEQGKLPIRNTSDYLVAAFMPDIRYFTREARSKYHFSVEALEPYRETDTSSDYLLGYQVHLLIDEVWEYPELKEAYKNAFPHLIRGRMTRGLQALAFEMYCLTRPITSIALEATENDLTRALGISDIDLEQAVDSMQRYIDQHDLAAALEMAKEAELFPTERLRTVERVVTLVKNPLVRTILYSAVIQASKGVFYKLVDIVVKKLMVSNRNQHLTVVGTDAAFN